MLIEMCLLTLDFFDVVSDSSFEVISSGDRSGSFCLAPADLDIEILAFIFYMSPCWYAQRFSCVLFGFFGLLFCLQSYLFFSLFLLMFPPFFLSFFSGVCCLFFSFSSSIAHNWAQVSSLAHGRGFFIVVHGVWSHQVLWFNSASFCWAMTTLVWFWAGWMKDVLVEVT